MNVPVEKNKEYEIFIEDLGSNGEGIGRVDGFTVFIEGGLPSEKIRVLIVKVKKSFAYGKIMEILEPSQDRVSPICEVAKWCGGCQLQHLSYKGQLEYKKKKTDEAIKRIGRVENFQTEKITGMDEPLYYRNKAQFPVSKDKGELKIGFYSKRSHNIIDTNRCYIQHKKNEEIIQIIRDFLLEYDISIYNEGTHKGLVRHIITRVSNVNGDMMVCFVINGNDLPKKEIIIEKLSEVGFVCSIVLNINTRNTNVITGDKIIKIYGEDFLQDSIDDISFDISPLSFYQVNPLQTEKLYKKALEFAEVSSEDNVLDLYCGIGTISLIFAKRVKKVFGVEIVPEAIIDARKNSEKNGIHNVEFFAGAVEDTLSDISYNDNIDIVVLDPPRKGCDERALESIVHIKPKKIVYVSCNPATLARDIEILGKSGYKIVKGEVFDQFPMSIHCEVVVRLDYHSDLT